MSDRLVDKNIKFSGRLTSLFRNCPKPSGWFAGMVFSKQFGQIKVTGTCSIKVSVGLHLDIVADLYKTSYGEEYRARTVIVAMNSDDAVIAYLSSNQFPKIGRLTAEKIVSEFHTDAVTYLLNQPEVVKTRCHLSDTQINILTKGILDSSIENQLQRSYPHLGSTWASAIVKQKTLGNTFESIVSKINLNPYCLLTIEKLGFKKADEVALLDCGLTWDDDRRVNEIAKLAMLEFMNKDKSTYLDLKNPNNLSLFETFMLKKLNHSVSQLFIVNAIQRLVQNRMFYLDESQNQKNLYLAEMREYEQTIVQEVNRHLHRLDDVNKRAVALFKKRKQHGQLSLNAGQEKALLTCLSNHIAIVTGGPGRGKTYFIQALADIWLSSNQNHQIIMLAPTGKAVNRMKEATGFRNVSTIARFMYQNRGEDREMGYIVSTDDKTVKISSHVLVIIDEASMIDFQEAAGLLDILQDCRIVFVGDKNQLPPIEAGPFFAELLKSKVVEVAELTENMRTKSIEISENADKIIVGDKAFQYTDHFMMMPTDDQDVLDNIVFSYQTLLANGADLKDILMMCPIREGAAAVTDINRRMQELLNPCINPMTAVVSHDATGKYTDTRGFSILAKKQGGLDFRIGDRVINLKNHADQKTRVYQNDDPTSTLLEESEGMFNGDMGTIVGYHFPSANHDFSSVDILFDNHRFVNISVEDFDEFALAYCITVHKAQGSEAEHILISMPSKLMYLRDFLSQNLLYTAVTRAKSSVTIFGSTEAMLACVGQPYTYHNTNLGEFIYDEFFVSCSFANYSKTKQIVYHVDCEPVMKWKAVSRSGKGTDQPIKPCDDLDDHDGKIIAGTRSGKGKTSLDKYLIK